MFVELITEKAGAFDAAVVHDVYKVVLNVFYAEKEQFCCVCLLFNDAPTLNVACNDRIL